jgi:hypothetical protein
LISLDKFERHGMTPRDWIVYQMPDVASSWFWWGAEKPATW